MVKLIIGLGNPGDKYKNNRHNVGFQIIDSIAKNEGICFDQIKFNGKFCVCLINGEKVVLAKPQTFMNLSGEFVFKFMQYFNIKTDEVLIIYDDVSLNIGDFKLKTSGSAGGQNGMKNIIALLHTQNIKRIKIGIGPKKQNESLANFVLKNFSMNEKNLINKVSTKINKVIEKLNSVNFENIFNGIK